MTRARQAHIKLIRNSGSEDPHELTPREVEVMELVAEGKEDKYIATRLELSPMTVRNYIKRIRGKLGANLNRTELALWFLQNYTNRRCSKCGHPLKDHRLSINLEGAAVAGFWRDQSTFEVCR